MTESERLRNIATRIWRKHKPDAAAAVAALDSAIADAPELRRALLRAYLGIISQGTPEPAPDEPGEEAPEGAASGASEQAPDAAQVILLPQPALETSSRRRDGAHRRSRHVVVRTQAQKEAALKAEAAYSVVGIWQRKLRGGRELGTVTFRELDALIAESGYAAASFVSRGYEDTVDAMILRELKLHAVSPDPDMLVRDGVSTRAANAIAKHAQVAAADFVRDAMEAYATRLREGDGFQLSA